MAWLLVVATIPAGLTGLALEHTLRTLFAKPLAAAIFLTLNGVILLVGERLRRRAQVAQARRRASRHAHGATEVGRRLDTLELQGGRRSSASRRSARCSRASAGRASRWSPGLLRGLDHEDAARFSFLLATPIIFAAGVYKLPDLAGHLGDGIRGQALVGSIFAGDRRVTSPFGSSMRFFETRTLMPFAIYCLVFGAISIVHFA